VPAAASVARHFRLSLNYGQDLPEGLLVMAVAPLVRTPAGLLVLGAIGVALSILGIRGKFDRVLKKLIVINVLGTLGLITFVVLSLFLPIVQIQHALEKK
jgi:FtsH-binding integral membrane protein